MPNNYGPKIVTDGLVMCLDAGNTKSYAGSGTTWTDLSRNGNNGTLTNGPTFNSANGGSIVFDASDDYVQCVGSITTTAATFISWIRRNGSQAFNAGIIFSRGTSTTGLNFRRDVNEVGYHWNDSGLTYNWVSGLVTPNLTWCMCAISVNSSSAVAYLCQSSGITSATNAISHTSTTLDDIRIGWEESSSTRRFNGNMAVAQIYNRALSAAEILQNYNATKGRFKL